LVVIADEIKKNRFTVRVVLERGERSILQNNVRPGHEGNHIFQSAIARLRPVRHHSPHSKRLALFAVRQHPDFTDAALAKRHGLGAGQDRMRE